MNIRLRKGYARLCDINEKWPFRRSVSQKDFECLFSRPFTKPSNTVPKLNEHAALDLIPLARDIQLIAEGKAQKLGREKLEIEMCLMSKLL